MEVSQCADSFLLFFKYIYTWMLKNVCSLNVVRNVRFALCWCPGFRTVPFRNVGCTYIYVTAVQWLYVERWRNSPLDPLCSIEGRSVGRSVDVVACLPMATSEFDYAMEVVGLHVGGIVEREVTWFWTENVRSTWLVGLYCVFIRTSEASVLCPTGLNAGYFLLLRFCTCKWDQQIVFS
jgi:hypothetical protein